MKYAIILIFSCINFHGYSQKLIVKPFIGLNTNVKSILLSKQQFLGADFGLQVEKKITKRISFESGFDFSIVRGNKYRPRILKNGVVPPETYYLTDIYNFNSIKLPIALLFSFKKSSNYVFGLGGYLKYHSKVKSSQFFDRNRVETNFKDFYLKTNNGNSFGVGLQASIRKTFFISHKQFCLGIYDEFDLSKWMYPRIGNSEIQSDYLFRKSNLSFLISMKL